MFTEEGGGDWRIKIGQPLYVIDKLQSANQPPDFVQHADNKTHTHLLHLNSNALVASGPSLM